MKRIINNNVFLEGRMVGSIYNGTFITNRNPKKHYYILGRGYPIADEILKFLDEHDINTIIIKERGRLLRYYRASVKQYLKGKLLQHAPFELQRVVPLNELEEIKVF